MCGRGTTAGSPRHPLTVRVLIVADSFGALPATEVAQIVAETWQSAAPHVRLESVAQASGAVGSARAIGEAVGARLTVVDGRRPLSAYVQGRQRAFLDAEGPGGAVGAAVRRLLDDGLDRVVLALGGAREIDGGRTFLQGLAGSGEFAISTDRVVGLAETDRVLLGFQGAAYAAVEERGLDKQQAQELEHAMGEWVDRMRTAQPARTDLLTGAPTRPERTPGAGAGGGLGFLLLATGGQVVSAPAYSAACTGLPDLIGAADLVVTTTTVFDWRALDHSVLHTTTSLANAHATAVVVLADEVHVGRREQMSLGVQGTYAVQRSGWMRPDSNTADAAAAQTDLAALTRRVANTWTPSRPPTT